MNPVGKALWFIEAHFGEPISLDDVAQAAGVDRFHLSRAFGLATGEPVMGYVRTRRLSEAAKALAAGAPDILTVALDAGYGSHEAFTRAFREFAGATPEQVRANGSTADLRLMEAKRMETTGQVELAPPRFEEVGPLLLAGIGEHHDGTNAGMPAQWQKFVPHLGHIPGQAGAVAYGVVYNFDGNRSCDYLCAVEVKEFGPLPAEFTRLRLPRRMYAIFAHRGHISGIGRTWAAIWNQWAPASGRKIADGAEVERYGEDFDGRTGMGLVEILIPVEP